MNGVEVSQGVGQESWRLLPFFIDRAKQKPSRKTQARRPMTKSKEVISWDQYFIVMAMVCAMRSKDPNTQVGCVIVDKKHRVVSTGCNGPPSGVIDWKLDWSRPNKYTFVRHAEQNAIAFSRKTDLNECVLYVTGPVCSKCMLEIGARGIRRVVECRQHIHMVDEEDRKKSKEIIKMCGITVASIDDIIAAWEEGPEAKRFDREIENICKQLQKIRGVQNDGIGLTTPQVKQPQADETH